MIRKFLIFKSVIVNYTVLDSLRNRVANDVYDAYNYASLKIMPVN